MAARRALVRLEFGILAVADADKSAAAPHIETDWSTLDRDHFADQFGDIRDWAARLAGIDLEDRRLLLRRGALVDIDGDAPVALQDVAGKMRDNRDRRVRDLDPVDGALVEMVGDDGVARSIVGIFPDPAGAENAAVADFQQSPFKMIRHGSPLSMRNHAAAAVCRRRDVTTQNKT